MSEFILEDRGRFWWQDEQIPERSWAPENSQIGTLKIDEEGTAILELDGLFPGNSTPFDIFKDLGSLFNQNKCIQGILKGNNKYVLLINVQGAGGTTRTNGISYPRYSANKCLISDDLFRQDPLLFQTMEVDLKGLEQWLRLGSINYENGQDRCTVMYEKPKEIRYSLSEGELLISFKHDLFSPFFKKTHKLILNESFFLSYHPKVNQSLDEMEKQFLLIQDLIMVLTGSYFDLDWPCLVSDGIKKRYYFSRMRGLSKEIELHESWTNFAGIQSNFGTIFSNWKENRETYGPGFYLYLGSLRRNDLFVENRFMNMIWGLEAFHRRKFGEAVENEKLKEKIRRILGALKRSRDKKWFTQKLRNASEPSLEDRIFGLFFSLPFDFKRDRIRDFSKKCAKIRHDITHFGGRRSHEDDADYSKFILEVAKLSKAVSFMYHALILQEIGVNFKIEEMYRLGWSLKHSLVEVGLWSKEILHDPKAIQSSPIHNSIIANPSPVRNEPAEPKDQVLPEEPVEIPRENQKAGNGENPGV